MARPFALALLIVLLAAGCTGPSGDIPSLQTRAAESMDPRLPVERPINDRPANPALVARLAALVAQAQAGEPRFDAAIDSARRAAGGAGAPQSEGWIVAQEALSGAVEARGPAAVALASIDSIGATLLAEQGGLAPSDQRAIEDAAATVGAIARRQAAAISAIQAQLGS
jgi:hypothetical protein